PRVGFLSSGAAISLSVRHVAKKDTVLVGFHEIRSAFVADMSDGKTWPPHVVAMLLPCTHRQSWTR
ncbi:MAG: hypothetical protein V4857_31320, partial [Pseudomonadota bacterium]